MAGALMPQPPHQGVQALMIGGGTLGGAMGNGLADPIFVGAHHLARFVMISVGLPFVARFWLNRPELRSTGGDGPLIG